MAKDNWAGRAARMRCEDCMWWVRKGGTHLGRCRRHAPSADAPGWPITCDSDFCGDFRLDEGRAVAVGGPPPAPTKLADMTPSEQVQKIRDAKERGEIRTVTPAT